MKNRFLPATARWSFVLVLCLPAIVSSQTQEVDNRGFVLGRVYEVDKEAYRAYIEDMRRQDSDFDESVASLDAEEFIDRRADFIVTARQLSSNQQFSSKITDDDGEYAIRDTPVGTFEFMLLHEGLEYPVRQRLDLNVQLSYVAELCFVVDSEEQVAWMVSDELRRSPEVPPWVPRECRSALSECLAGFLGGDERLPDGLILLLAGSGATATAIGIISADQDQAGPLTQAEASPPVSENQPQN
jgi:hypothetical protein